jgi:hypothetical protein
LPRLEDGTPLLLPSLPPPPHPRIVVMESSPHQIVVEDDTKLMEESDVT